MEDDLSASEATALLEELRPTWAYAIGGVWSDKLLRGVWALNAIQSDTISLQSTPLLNAPAEAYTQDMTSKFKVHPWELETIINEHLVHRHEGFYRSFSPADWNHWAHTISLLRRVENAEAGVFGSPERIIDHLFHIGSRQFEWQAGFLNHSELFRGIFVYGQGECAAYFEQKYGLSIQSLFAYGFGLMSMFMQSPHCKATLDLSVIGLTKQEGIAAAKILCGDIDKLSEIARLEREGDTELAYKPSVLRLIPCIRAGFRKKYLFCALPELIMKRISTGIFYDVADGGHHVREDYGRRFEDYVSLLIETYQPNFILEREQKYKTKLGEFRTPDIFLSRTANHVDLIVECKATRMSYKTRFTDIDDLGPANYDEMTKAVFQIWRHVWHARTGKAEPKPNDKTVGLVLTFDDWFQGGVKRQELVVNRARQMFESKCPNATEVDQIPIAFASMTEFEFLLQTGNESSIVESLSEAAKPEKRGWSVTSLHREYRDQDLQVTDFPFEDQLSAILPLWGKIREGAKKRREETGPLHNGAK